MDGFEIEPLMNNPRKVKFVFNCSSVLTEYIQVSLDAGVDLNLGEVCLDVRKIVEISKKKKKRKKTSFLVLKLSQ